jgi:predicted phage terminase large subunit-like protein
MSLSDFIAEAWSVLEPNTRYQGNWHIDYLSEELEAVTNGDTKRLIINIAPRHMKSLLVSVMWPCWEWTRQPWTRWLFASYVDELALKHSTDRRSLITSDFYQQRWGGIVRLSPDQNQKSGFTNTRRGAMKAISFGGSVTGLGGNRIVIDDPMNPRMAHSEKERQAVIDFYTKSLHNRLDQPKEDAIVIVQQRLHDNDLVGYLDKHMGEEEVPYKLVKLATEAPKREVYTSAITKTETRREEGELLWPDRFDRKAINTEKVIMGPMEFASQHQQEPAPTTGGVVKDAWWRFYRTGQKDLIVQAASEVATFTDSAFETGEENDYSVTAVWAKVKGNRFDVPPGFYLLDLWRERLEFPELKKRVPRTFHDWKARTLVVEKKASGHSLVQELRRIPLPVKVIVPVKDKLARMNARTGWIEQGLVFLPEFHPLLEAFLDEHRKFPKGEHDDMVDTTSMMLDYWTGRATWDQTEDDDGEGWGEFFAEVGVA